MTMIRNGCNVRYLNCWTNQTLITFLKMQNEQNAGQQPEMHGQANGGSSGQDGAAGTGMPVSVASLYEESNRLMTDSNRLEDEAKHANDNRLELLAAVDKSRNEANELRGALATDGRQFEDLRENIDRLQHLLQERETQISKKEEMLSHNVRQQTIMLEEAAALRESYNRKKANSQRRREEAEAMRKQAETLRQMVEGEPSAPSLPQSPQAELEQARPVVYEGRLSALAAAAPSLQSAMEQAVEPAAEPARAAEPAAAEAEAAGSAAEPAAEPAAAPKRGVGRPRKVQQQPAAQAEPEPDAAPKRGVGRPKKVQQQPAAQAKVEAEDEPAAAPRRGRGRPRKEVIDLTLDPDQAPGESDPDGN